MRILNFKDFINENCGCDDCNCKDCDCKDCKGCDCDCCKNCDDSAYKCPRCGYDDKECTCREDDYASTINAYRLDNVIDTKKQNDTDKDK